NDLPFRLELFGNEVESIRTFDPSSQLSQDSIDQISIIPNVQTRLLQESRQSFVEFLPDNANFWFKDLAQCLDVIDAYFAKATENFETIIKASGNTKVVLDPQDLFENKKTFKTQLKEYIKIEFGKRFFYKTATIFTFDAEAQPSFNKN